MYLMCYSGFYVLFCVYHNVYDNLYLSEHSPYDTIVIEVDYHGVVPSSVPSSRALDLLEKRIESYSGKEVIWIVAQDIPDDEVPDKINENESRQFVNLMKGRHQNHHTEWLGGNITLYVVYVYIPLPRSEEDVNTSIGGLTTSVDSFIVFKKGLHPYDEPSVLVHETGHVFSLSHCSNESCVMHTPLQVLSESNDFCPDCQHILQKKTQAISLYQFINS